MRILFTFLLNIHIYIFHFPRMSVIFVLYEAIAHMYDIVSFLDNQKALHFTQ